MATSEFPSAGMELTNILVVGDLGRSRDFCRDLPGAELYRKYGGTPVVLRLFGTWLLTGGGPTPTSHTSPSPRRSTRAGSARR